MHLKTLIKYMQRNIIIIVCIAYSGKLELTASVLDIEVRCYTCTQYTP